MSEKIVTTNSSEATAAIFGAFDSNVRIIERAFDIGLSDHCILVGVQPGSEDRSDHIMWRWGVKEKVRSVFPKGSKNSYFQILLFFVLS